MGQRDRNSQAYDSRRVCGLHQGRFLKRQHDEPRAPPSKVGSATIIQHDSEKLNCENRDALVRFLYLRKTASPALAGETAADFTPILYMLGFGLLASVPALILSRLVSPRRRYNPVKFLPMECGQMPTGEGRSHFMMQYYAYILMFVVFDVMSIFLYTWASSLFLIPRSATLPIMAFLGIMFAAMGYALYLAGRKGIW